MLLFCVQWHRTRTILGNPSVMISSIADNCIPSSVWPQHTRLISSNRLCYYQSSDTFLITGLFAVYHTHLVILNRFCSLSSKQTVHPSEPHALYRTHLNLADRFFVLPNHKQFIRVNRMLYIAHAFIWLAISFVPPHRKRLIELNRMPCIAHATKIWTVFDASAIANVLQLFWRVFTPPFAIIASHTVSSKGLRLVSR